MVLWMTKFQRMIGCDLRRSSSLEVPGRPVDAQGRNGRYLGRTKILKKWLYILWITDKSNGYYGLRLLWTSKSMGKDNWLICDCQDPGADCQLVNQRNQPTRGLLTNNLRSGGKKQYLADHPTAGNWLATMGVVTATTTCRRNHTEQLP